MLMATEMSVHVATTSVNSKAVETGPAETFPVVGGSAGGVVRIMPPPGATPMAPTRLTPPAYMNTSPTLAKA